MRPWPRESHLENLRVIGSSTEQTLPKLCGSHSVTLGLESKVPPEEDTDSRLIHQSYKSLL